MEDNFKRIWSWNHGEKGLIIAYVTEKDSDILDNLIELWDKQRRKPEPDTLREGKDREQGE